MQETEEIIVKSSCEIGIKLKEVERWQRRACRDLGSKGMMLQRGQFPGGPVVETLPSNTGCEGSIPGLGNKIPHAVQCSQQNKMGCCSWDWR